MSVEKVREYLKAYGMAERVLELPVSSATVALAAQALGCAEARIAKSMSFDVQGQTVLVVTAGDRKIDNGKFKARFACKAKMLPPDRVEERVGHAVGGVCPFGIREDVQVYLDESLRRFDTVYPACGSANSAIRMTLPELEESSRASGWVDVCKETAPTPAPQEGA